MEHKIVAWQLTLPNGQYIGGSKRLYIPQDWDGLETYFQEVQAEMLEKTLAQKPVISQPS